jgi:hypothetical protein
MSDDSIAGNEYARLIAETLAEERKRKDSLEGRGLQVVTTSGGLVTLLVALSRLAGVDVVDAAPRVLIWLSLAAFVAAAVGGLLVNRPATYEEVSADELARLAESEDFWTGPKALGSRRSAEVQVKVLQAARVVNAMKAETVYWAMFIEVVAIGLLAAGIGYSVLRAGA